MDYGNAQHKFSDTGSFFEERFFIANIHNYQLNLQNKITQMKQISFFLLLLILISCGGNGETKQLPGTFKYLSYHWNNTSDSVGLWLNHYIEITKAGDYKIIMRNGDSTGYYYGFIDTAFFDALNTFIADASLKSAYLPAGDNSKYSGPISRLDYVTATGKKVITFIPDQSAESIQKISAQLEAIINAPGKKVNNSFNIDFYLKSVIKETNDLLSPPSTEKK